MERGDKVGNTYSLVAVSNGIQCWEYPSQPLRIHPWQVVDTSLPLLNDEKVSRKTTVLVASLIQQELCKSLDGLCWKGIDNMEDVCCFLAGISLHLVLVCRSLPRIRLTSGGLLFSQIILNQSFVNRGISLMFLSGCFTTKWCIYTHVFKMCWKIQFTFRLLSGIFRTFHYIKENRLFCTTVE